MENSDSPFPAAPPESDATVRSKGRHPDTLPMGLSSPLGFKLLLRAQRPGFSSLPWINLGAITLLFSLNYGFFVYGGLGINLPHGNATLSQGVPTTAVLTIRGSNIFFFNGAQTDAGGLGKALKAYLEERKIAHPVLLIKADDGLPLGVLYQTCETARQAGFENAQIGSKNRAASEP